MPRLQSVAARLSLALLATLGLLASGAAHAKSVGSINFTLGGKRMTSDWYLSAPQTNAAGDTIAQKSSQPALGVEITWGREGWPALIAFDVLHSYDDGLQRFPASELLSIPAADVRRRARTIEVSLGARRAWSILGLSPYLGAGGSWVRGSLAYEMSYPDQATYGAPGPRVGERETTFGYWVGGGVYRRLGPRFQLGGAVRYSKADLTFSEFSEVRGEQGGYTFVAKPTKVAAGGLHFGLVVGWTYPKR
jgi:hypothetical protein